MPGVAKIQNGRLRIRIQLVTQPLPGSLCQRKIRPADISFNLCQLRPLPDGLQMNDVKILRFLLDSLLRGNENAWDYLGLTQQTDEQRGTLGCKRIGNCHAAPGKTILKIFT